MKTTTKSIEPEDEIRHFCTMCFADNKGGSWGESTVPLKNGGHCFNCGAGGTLVEMPAWAVENIRKNGSWVCKRYYPADEDRENFAELKALRALVTEPPGRSAEPLPNEPGRYMVRQVLGGGRTQMQFVDAKSEDEAFQKTRTTLPYVPKDSQ